MSGGARTQRAALGFLLSIQIGGFLQRWLDDCSGLAAAAALTLGIALVSLCIVLWRASSTRRMSATDSATAPLAKVPALTWQSGFIAGIATLLLGFQLAMPPAGWDALTYHLNFALHWSHSGSCSNPQTAFGDYSPDYYPLLHSQALYLLSLLTPTAAPLAIAGWYFLYCIALIRIARNWRASTGPVDLSGPFVVAGALLPYVASGLLCLENDMALSACLLCCLAELGPGERQDPASPKAVVRTTHWLWASIALGLGASLKYLGLLYAVGLGLWALIAIRPHWKAWLALLLPATLAAAPWYLHNLWLTGNPLYPAELRVANWTLFPGYYPPEYFSVVPAHAFSWYGWLSDPGVLLALAAPAAAIMMPGLVGRLPDTVRRPGWLFASAAGLLLFLLFWQLSPLRQHRLAGAPLALAYAAAAPLIFQTRRPGYGEHIFRVVLAAGAALGVAMLAARLQQLYGPPWDLAVTMSDYDRATARFLFTGGALLYLAALLLAGLCGAFCSRLLHGPFRLRALLAAAALVLGGGLAAVQVGSKTRYAGGDLAAAWNTARSLPPAASGIIGVNAVAPFRGRDNLSSVILLLNRAEGELPLHLRRERIIISTDSIHATDNAPDRTAFYQNLKALQRLILVQSGPWPPERDWLRQRSDWTLRHAWPTVEIYESHVTPSR
ncbi:MAG: hypothetical protein K1X75_01730 [Leptospirales bacterium]|nr:hypothetical protein [Leptospirales bacterium]